MMARRLIPCRKCGNMIATGQPIAACRKCKAWTCVRCHDDGEYGR